MDGPPCPSRPILSLSTKMVPASWTCSRNSERRIVPQTDLGSRFRNLRNRPTVAGNPLPDSKVESDMKTVPPFKLVPEPLNEQAASLGSFKWAAKEVGQRHRLGGQPEGIKAEDWPKCVNCDERMTFYGQLDSIDDEICIADCGLILVFLCFECYQVHAQVHSS